MKRIRARIAGEPCERTHDLNPADGNATTLSNIGFTNLEST